MFQFSGLALFRVTDLLPAGLPHSEIFGLTLVAAPRSLSQLTTSFIASRIQGIHRVPLIYLYALIYLFYITPICQRTFLVSSDKHCGEYRSRTDDLLLARQAL